MESVQSCLLERKKGYREQNITGGIRRNDYFIIYRMSDEGGEYDHENKETNNAAAGSCAVYCMGCAIVCISISAIDFIRQAGLMLYPEVCRPGICLYSSRPEDKNGRLY